MSAEDEEDRGVLRMVTAPYRSQQNEEMTLIGMLYAVGLVIVVLPLVPFIVLLWLISGLRDVVGSGPVAE